jgi:hypothetical protein
VRNFDKIVLNASCDVHYVQGNVPSVRISGPSDVVKNIVTECDGTTLTIKYSKVFSLLQLSNQGNVAVFVTSPDLIDVTMNGSGDFTADGKIDSDTLNVSLFGSGDVYLSNIICDKMNTLLKGSGDVDIKRLECQESTIFLSGAGDIDVKQYHVAKSNVTLRGVGDIDLDLNDCGSADCELYGVGDITLKGNVKTFKQNVMGTGNIDSEELKVDK